MFFLEQEIDALITEDVPYFDLTTFMLEIGEKTGKMSFTTRKEIVVSCTEEAVRVLQKLGCTVSKILPSGAIAKKDEVILNASGSARSLHVGWRVCLILLEYACGIATRTRNLVTKAKSVNQGVMIGTTRKTFPGGRKIAAKSVLAGGAFPHRLGLSETFLAFRQHLAFIGGMDGFLKKLETFKHNLPEKKIVVEVDNLKDATKLAETDVDGIQFDKFSVEELTEAIKTVHFIKPTIKTLAAGGIDQGNIEAYARTKANVLVLSSAYFGKPADIGVTIEPL